MMNISYGCEAKTQNQNFGMKIKRRMAENILEIGQKKLVDKKTALKIDKILTAPDTENCFLRMLPANRLSQYFDAVGGQKRQTSFLGKIAEKFNIFENYLVVTNFQKKKTSIIDSHFSLLTPFRTEVEDLSKIFKNPRIIEKTKAGLARLNPSNDLKTYLHFAQNMDKPFSAGDILASAVGKSIHAKRAATKPVSQETQAVFLPKIDHITTDTEEINMREINRILQESRGDKPQNLEPFWEETQDLTEFLT